AAAGIGLGRGGAAAALGGLVATATATLVATLIHHRIVEAIGLQLRVHTRSPVWRMFRDSQPFSPCNRLQRNKPPDPLIPGAGLFGGRPGGRGREWNLLYQAHREKRFSRVPGNRGSRGPQAVRDSEESSGIWTQDAVERFPTDCHVEAEM